MGRCTRLFTQWISIIHFAVNRVYRLERSEAKKDTSILVQIRVVAFPLSKKCSYLATGKDWINPGQLFFFFKSSAWDADVMQLRKRPKQSSCRKRCQQKGPLKLYSWNQEDRSGFSHSRKILWKFMRMKMWYKQRRLFVLLSKMIVNELISWYDCCL